MIITDERYGLPDLTESVKVKLSGNIWRSEGLDLPSVIELAVNSTLLTYSRRVPRTVYEQIPAGSGQYAVRTVPCFGPFSVDFIDGNTGFFTSAYQLNNNLLGVSSIQLAGGKVGDLADFLQWRKMFQRVVSYRPDWQWLEDQGKILIHNPSGYMACAILYAPRTFEQVRLNHRDWFFRMTVAQARLQLGEYRSKFQSIPGPGGKDLQLNGAALVTQANSEIEKLMEELRGFQVRLPVTFD